MAIYETFLQHIIASLSPKGKAAVVVPTGFVSASSVIPLKIRQHLVDKNWLRGVIHMPSNIFANTGTSVSIVFIDKAKQDDKVMLMDASNLGTKVSLEDGQRTVLSFDEKEKIMSFFKERIEEPEFSVLVKNEQIKENNYSIQAGQYVEIIIYEVDIEVDNKLFTIENKLLQLFKESEQLSLKISDSFKKDI